MAKNCSLLATIIVLFLSSTIASGQDGHHFGKWPAINAAIHHQHQKNLDLDGSAFLIETWFKPLEQLKYKTDSATNCLISKGIHTMLAGYQLEYTNNGHLSFSACDKAKELEKARLFTAAGMVNMGGWNYVALSYSPGEKKLTFFLNGEVSKVYKNVELGDMSNEAPFCVTYSKHSPSGQANCQMSQARLWKFGKELPEGLADAIKSHNETPAKPSELLKKNASYSAWTFTAANDDVADAGTNGNTLFYAPLNYKQPVEAAVSDAPKGVTYYVSANAPSANDQGPGTEDKPFSNIARAAKAAMPGDTIKILPGLYREGILLRAGQKGRPITVEGQDGVVVSGSTQISGWQKNEKGMWVVQDWKGNYNGPIDVRADDVRSQPQHNLMVDGQPMECVLTHAELVPGSWMVEPLKHSGPKTFTLYPLPGVDPTKSNIELTDTRGVLGTTQYNHIRNIHFTGSGIGVHGRNNLVENCQIDWTAGGGVGITGRDNVVRNNRIFWCGHTGLGGGGGIGNTFEGNVISYSCWRRFQGSWHGGAIKIIPSTIDFVMRNNEISYNYVSGIWYDSGIQGTLNEGNICHDNMGSGLFDEFNFGNTWQNNISYNNVGPGFCIGNSKEDKIHRNILFNNAGGLYYRTDHIGTKNTEEVRKAMTDEYSSKLDVRRYQGMIPYAREKSWRDMYHLYSSEYIVSCNMRNETTENVVIDHQSVMSQAIKYGKTPVAKDIENNFKGNYYWCFDKPTYIGNGGQSVDLKTWQELSGQDQGSKYIDPWANRDQMPEWFKERFHFKKDQFRPAGATWGTYIEGKVRRSISQVVLYSRLVRSPVIEQAKFSDPDVSGLYFEHEGKKCLSLWCKGATTKYFLLPDVEGMISENKYLQGKPIKGGRSAGIFLDEDPMTLIGVGSGVLEDKSILIQVPNRTDPGQPIEAVILLENEGTSPKAFDLVARIGDGWQITPDKIQRELAPGQKLSLPIKLLPPQATEGIFHLQVSGNVADVNMQLSKIFNIGELRAVKRTGSLAIDGDLADWKRLSPTGIADKAAQVVNGADQWKGPEDLSAKVTLAWHNMRNLYLAVEVTDDQLVTLPDAQDQTQGDSVELFVDVRAVWKHYLQEYTPGAFKIVIVPGKDGAPAVAKYIGQEFGQIKKVASKKTDKGYIVELEIYFRSNLVEQPGWVTGREIRAGVLVNDLDDQAAKTRKSTIGAWRTAADAPSSCGSLTTLKLED